MNPVVFVILALIFNAFMLPAVREFLVRRGVLRRSANGSLRPGLRWFLIVAVAVVVLGVVDSYRHRRDAVEVPRAKREILPVLVEEFSAVPTMPGAEEQVGRRKSDVTAGRIGVWAVVATRYNSPASYREIIEFYDGRLRARGWTLSREVPHGQGSPGEIQTAAIYCKGELECSIEVLPLNQRVHGGWSYALMFDWVLGRGCDRHVGPAGL